MFLILRTGSGAGFEAGDHDNRLALESCDEIAVGPHQWRHHQRIRELYILGANIHETEGLLERSIAQAPAFAFVVSSASVCGVHAGVSNGRDAGGAGRVVVSNAACRGNVDLGTAAARSSAGGAAVFQVMNPGPSGVMPSSLDDGTPVWSNRSRPELLPRGHAASGRASAQSRHLIFPTFFSHRTSPRFEIVLQVCLSDQAAEIDSRHGF